MNLRCALSAILLAPPTAVLACGADLPGAKSVESARYVVAYRTEPERVAVGKHFSVEMAVCPKGGAQPPESVRVDAHMPDHRHGMNYKARVVPAAGDRYRAEGLMFHMPGRWEFVFDLRGAGKTDRLTQSHVLE